jgi:hypothetical protein
MVEPKMTPLEKNIELVWNGYNANKMTLLKALLFYKQSLVCIQGLNKEDKELLKIKEAIKFVRKTTFEDFKEGNRV